MAVTVFWSVTVAYGCILVLALPCKGHERRSKETNIHKAKDRVGTPCYIDNGCHNDIIFEQGLHGINLQIFRPMSQKHGRLHKSVRKKRSVDGEDDISNMDSRRKIYNDFLQRMLRGNRQGKKKKTSSLPKPPRNRNPRQRSTSLYATLHERRNPHQEDKQRIHRPTLEKRSTTPKTLVTPNQSQSQLRHQIEREKHQNIRRSRDERLRKLRKIHQRHKAALFTSEKKTKTGSQNKRVRTDSEPRLSVKRNPKTNYAETKHGHKSALVSSVQKIDGDEPERGVVAQSTPTSPFLSAPRAKDYLTRLDSTIQHKKLRRRVPLTDDLADQNRVTATVNVNSDGSSSISSLKSKLSQRLRFYHNNDKRQRKERGHRRKQSKSLSDVGATKSDNNSTSNPEIRQRYGNSAAKKKRSKNSIGKRRRNRGKHRKRRKNRKRKRRKRKQRSRQKTSTESLFPTSTFVYSTSEYITPTIQTTELSIDKGQQNGNEQDTATESIISKTVPNHETTMPVMLERHRSTLTEQDTASKSSTLKSDFEQARIVTRREQVVSRGNIGVREYNSVTITGEKSKPDGEHRNTNSTFDNNIFVHIVKTEPSIFPSTTTTVSSLAKVTKNNDDGWSAGDNIKQMADNDIKRIQETKNSRTRNKKKVNSFFSTVNTSYVNASSNRRDLKDTVTSMLNNDTTDILTFKTNNISDLSHFVVNTSLLEEDSHDITLNLNDNSKGSTTLFTTVSMKTASKSSLNSSPIQSSYQDKLITTAVTKNQTYLSSKPQMEISSIPSEQTSTTSSQASTISKMHTTKGNPNMSRWLAWAKKRRNRARKKSKSRARKTRKLSGSMARGSVAVSLAKAEKIKTTSTVSSKRVLSEPTTTKGPFIGYKTAYDFLSNQKGLKVGILSENRRESHLVNKVMGENMCEIFDKHYVPTQIGGKCV